MRLHHPAEVQNTVIRKIHKCLLLEYVRIWRLLCYRTVTLATFQNGCARTRVSLDTHRSPGSRPPKWDPESKCVGQGSRFLISAGVFQNVGTLIQDPRSRTNDSESRVLDLRSCVLEPSGMVRASSEYLKILLNPFKLLKCF